MAVSKDSQEKKGGHEVLQIYQGSLEKGCPLLEVEIVFSPTTNPALTKTQQSLNLSATDKEATAAATCAGKLIAAITERLQSQLPHCQQ